MTAKLTNENCSQAQCGERAVAAYHWPGRERAFICVKCLPKLVTVSKAMGLALHTVIETASFDNEWRPVTSDIEIALRAIGPLDTVAPAALFVIFANFAAVGLPIETARMCVNEVLESCYSVAKRATNG